MTRVCKTCGVEKPMAAYGKSVKGRGGRMLHCKPCVRVIRRHGRPPEVSPWRSSFPFWRKKA